MSLFIQIISRSLQFKFDARTSRGAMQQHQVYYLRLINKASPEKSGIGECAPLPGLSLEHHAGFANKLDSLVSDINNYLNQNNVTDLEPLINDKKLKEYSSLIFALETAWLDYKNGGNKILFNNNFSSGKAGIPINGLIWMGNKLFMQEQIKAKLLEGYSCLKMKIGGLDFETELELLKSIRQVADPESLTIRVDANGAFSPVEAQQKLDKLAKYKLHSIEQPIRAGQPEAMQTLCRNSPIPIALDEELIGLHQTQAKTTLLSDIKPQYIILKPTLAGGLKGSAEWIELAQKQNIDWWITSALESNIGLNAISQFTGQYPITIPQGLGTGKLYQNNINSPLIIRNGSLYFDTDSNWDEID